MSASLDAIMRQLRAGCGVDFCGYRQGVIDRGVRARMQERSVGDLDEYFSCLRHDAGESNALLDAMTINVSSFFRDPHVFKRVSEKVLPAVIDRKHREGDREIRVWSAGCAAGEEAYSLAILLREGLGSEWPSWQPLVFATDIDGEALAAARRAVFPRDRLENAKQGVIDRYFVRCPEGRQVCASVKATVRCSWDDLASERFAAPTDSVFGSFDLIFCRNVLIYFTPQLRSRVVRKLCRALTPGGYLVLGMAEFLAPDTEISLETIDRGCRILRRVPWPNQAVPQSVCRQ